MGASDQRPAPFGTTALSDEITNLNEMARHSYKKAFIRDLRGDQAGAAFWRGRARGLELAAINLGLPPVTTDVLGQPERPLRQGPNR